MANFRDPRPLTSEPLSMDLLNTLWIDADGHHDLLESEDGLALWLSRPQLHQVLAETEVEITASTRQALIATRTALTALVADPTNDAARAALNEVLAHGWLRRRLSTHGPGSLPEADSGAWLPAWAVANDYLRLLAERPDRIRKCANPECVLHFYDSSRNGTRRWCSMTGCGNRAKASRHYARQKS